MSGMAGGVVLVVGLAICAGLMIQGGAEAAPKLPSDDLLHNPSRAADRFGDLVLTAGERRVEAAEKVTRVRKMLNLGGWDGLVIATERNLNWVTAGGKDNVLWVQRETPVKLLITPDRLHLIADNIEGPRMMAEEVNGLGYTWNRYEWHGNEKDALEPLIKGKKIAFDLPAAALTYRPTEAANVVADLGELYYPLTHGELKKYRWLGKKTAEVLEEVARVVRPGMTEHDVQYLLCREFWYWDIVPTVVLSAVDERFKTFRHPVVVGAKLQKYVALNVCTRRWGLAVSTTRLVHFGEPEPELASVWAAGPEVMAAMWEASRPGNTLGDVFKAGQSAYQKIGFAEEWKLHHQGGLIHGLERLFLVQPGDKTVIRPGMVLAWNPTVRGSKFEDTVLVKEDGTLENLTEGKRWPMLTVKVGTRSFRIPGLMIRSAGGD